MARNHDPNFVAETKFYYPDVYKSFTRENEYEIMRQINWRNIPPPVFNIEEKSGKAVPGMNLVSAIQAHFREVCKTGGTNGT